jgi:hypothetical protein
VCGCYISVALIERRDSKKEIFRNFSSVVEALASEVAVRAAVGRTTVL